MIELGQLEKRHGDFDKLGVRVVVISNDDLQIAQATQADFPHLVVIADAKQQMAKAMQVVHEGVGPQQTDTNAPTTFLVDGVGEVRWLFRPTSFIARLSPDEVIAAIKGPLKE